MSIAVGLFRKNKLLVFIPEQAKFPGRCVFTNEPTDKVETLKLKSYDREEGAVTVTIEKKELNYPIPVSKNWLRRRAATSRLVGRVILIIGAVSLPLAIILGNLRSVVGAAVQDILLPTLSVAGFLGLVVGLAWPFLKDVNGTKGILIIHGCKFYRDAVTIPKCSPAFLAQLPEWEGELE